MYDPAGIGPMTDGVDDEIKLTADTASVSCGLYYMFG